MGGDSQFVFKYKQQHTFEQRRQEADRVRERHPGHFPVICEKVDGSTIADLDVNNFPVAADLTVGQFLALVRKRVMLEPEESIFLFIGDSPSLPTSVPLSEFYNKYMDEDGFLYVKYSGDYILRSSVVQRVAGSTATVATAAMRFPLAVLAAVSTAPHKQLTTSGNNRFVFKYKQQHTFEQRRQEADRVRERHPDRLPVICEKVDGSTIADLDVNNFPVAADLTVGQFLALVRKRVMLEPEENIFLFIGDSHSLPTSVHLSEFYGRYKDEDGFLYVKYSGDSNNRFVFKYKQQHTFEQRRQEAERVRKLNPDRIPVICEKVVGSKIADLDKNKFLVPSGLTVGNFMIVVHKRLMLEPEMNIFLFIGDSLPPTSALMSESYSKYKGEDGFLYVKYSGENTFGATA